MSRGVQKPTADPLSDSLNAQRVHVTLDGPKPPHCSLAQLIASAKGALVDDHAERSPVNVRQFERQQRARANSRASRMTAARSGLLVSFAT